MYNYSIVIPHKNIPSLLYRCLASIPMRDDVQVIVVDDNSNVDSFSLLHVLENRYPSVEFIYTTCSKGAGYARNIGLTRAKGRWLIFADADDYFGDNFNEILDKYIDNDDEVIFFNYASVYSDTGDILNIRSFRKSKFDNLLNNKNYLEEYLRYEFGPPWSKFIKKSVIDNYDILFDETTKHNDTMFSLKVGFYAQKVKMDSMILYYNTYRDDSITTANVENKNIYVDNIMGVALRYKNFSEANNLKNVRWRFFSIVEILLRTDFSLLSYILKFVLKNRLLLYFLLNLPIYIVRRGVKFIFKPKTWLF